MEKSLKEKVEEALRAAVPDASTVELNVEDGKVGGLVLSGLFASMSPSARQDLIWEQLDKSLNTFERTRVVFIVTDTPKEYEALKKAAGE